MRGDSSTRLTLLCDAEKLALYGLPDFDDFQRVEFFAMTETERALAFRRKGLTGQVYCLLQIGALSSKVPSQSGCDADIPPDQIDSIFDRATHCTAWLHHDAKHHQ